MDEEVGQGPGLGVGVGALLRVAEPLVVAIKRLERIGRPRCEILVELGQPRPVHRPDAAPALALRRSGVSKYMAMPSLNHSGQSLCRACRPQLKAIWCVASWTIVATVRTASGLREDLVDLRRRAARRGRGLRLARRSGRTWSSGCWPG